MVPPNPFDELVRYLLAKNDPAVVKALSSNPRLTIDHVLSAIDKEWEWDYLRSNAGITMADIAVTNDHRERWNESVSRAVLYAVFKNPNLTIDCLKRELTIAPIVVDVAMELASMNHGIKVADMFKHPELPWNWFTASFNHTLTIHDILAHPDLVWEWQTVSANRGITFRDVTSHPELNWDWVYLSMNSNITLEDVLSTLTKPWAFDYLSSGPSIDIRDILAHPELPWDWGHVSRNPTITIQTVLDHPTTNWDWNHLSMNSGIRLRDILAYPELPWNYTYVSVNGSLTVTKVLANRDTLPWNWTWVADNYLGLDDDHRPSNEFREALASVCIELESAPAGRFKCLPAGGVHYQQQLRDFGALILAAY